MALMLARAAMEFYDAIKIYSYAKKVYAENSFYKIIAQDFSYIFSVAFSPDGQSIVTGSWNQNARLWDVPMPLDEFLESGWLAPLTTEQKKKYGIE